MRRIYTLLALFLFFLAARLLAADNEEAKKKEFRYIDWMLCVTEFDTSLLPPTQAAMGRTVEKELTAYLNGLDFKLRNAREYDYYWGAEWMNAQQEIAKKIAAKQTERDKLIFLDYTDWRYRREREKIDAEIQTLREQLENAELSSPNVARIPRFSVNENNINGIFPESPAQDNEYFFCKDNKLDGLLKGKISRYHERFLVEVQLWTVWTRSYSYKDTIVFSIEDMDTALREFASQLIDAISGMDYATVRVSAKPDNALIVVDGQLIGAHGKTEDIARTPGPVDITVYAQDHEPVTETVNLNEGEYADVLFELKSSPTGSYTVDTENGEQARVYQGGLFAGTTPLTLNGVVDSYGQISIQTEDKRTSQMIFQIKDKSSLSLDPKTPPPEDRVEKARKSFYGAFGRFWIGLPVGFILIGMSNTYINTYNIAPNTSGSGDHYDTAKTWINVQMGAFIGIGLLLADVLIRLTIYIYQGNRSGAILSEKPKSPISEPLSAESPTLPPEESGVSE
ncbi:MAG: PEGA domain-containing protein [Spirochaetaceae bacterium]|jgi:predicted RNA-binding protein Jag|nr:PEGA domain-containing protein [Spirochaetaceae bacterium]